MRNDDNPHTFLFALDDGMVIDATNGGNSARWINHSCAPNCEAVDDADRIYIETLRAIRPGEELSYNYRIELEERHTPRTEAAVPVPLRRAPLQRHHSSAEEEE